MNDVLKQLVPIRETQIGNSSQKCVSARELHTFLEIKKDFSTWMNLKIKKYQFIENQDFARFSPKMGNTKGGRPKIYFALTLSMAKELSMVQNNKKGQEARQYFIQCEAKLQSSRKAIIKMASDPIISMRLKQIEMEERLTIVEAKITTKDEDYYSISGYARLKGVRVTKRIAHGLGIQAGKLSRAKEMPISPVYDAKYGSINSYHTSILEEIFQPFLQNLKNQTNA